MSADFVVAAGQPIRATHINQFTRWLTGITKNHTTAITNTHATDYTLTLTNEDTAAGNVLKLISGASTVGLFNKTGVSFGASPLLLTGVNSTAYALIVQNSHTQGRAFQINDATGTAIVTVQRTTSGNDVVIFADNAAGTPPNASRFLCYSTSSIDYVNADFQIDVAAGDCGAIRGFAFQQTGGSLIRGGEFQASRYTSATAAGLYGIEVGIRTGWTHASPDAQVGIRLYNAAGFGVAAATVANTALYVDGAAGWNDFIRLCSGAGTAGTVLFRVAGSSPLTGDTAGDVIGNGRIYSNQLGSAFKVGVIPHTSATGTEVWAGLHYSTSTNVNALVIGGHAAGVGARNILIGPGQASAGQGVGIGVSEAELAAGVGGMPAGLLPARLFVDGVIGTEDAIITKKQTAVSTPLANYSALAPLTDENWYRKTSGATQVQMMDATLMARRNLVINGGPLVWQRGTSSPTTADNGYGPDHWRLLLESASCATISRGSSAMMTTASHYNVILTGTATNNNKFGIFQPIEGTLAWRLRGTVASLQAKLLTSTTRLGTIKMALLAWSSTEDGTSGDPISSWGGEGTNPTLAANWTYATTPADATSGSITSASLTTAAIWKVENISVSATATNLGVFIWCDDRTWTSADTFTIGDIQVEAGNVCTTFEHRIYTDELALCQRYYQRRTGQSYHCQMFAISTAVAFGTMFLPGQMRTAPTIGFSTAANWNFLNSAGNPTNLTASGVVIQFATPDVVTLTGTATSSTLVAGNGTALYCSTATDYLEFIAEI